MSDAPESQLQARLAAMANRIDKLESRVNVLTRAFALARHQNRRIWLRPPIWTFEQHAPRNLVVPASYRDDRPPANAPSVAIVTPSYEQGAYLKATIDSVLDQKYPRLQYHVQDGGSGDDSVEVLQTFGSILSWRSEPDQGQTQAINRGFSAVTGDIMAYLNSDDMLMPGTLAYVTRVFDTMPEVDIVYGHRIYINGEGLEIGRAVLPAHDAKALRWADYIPQETLFWRRRVWDAVGPFDETFQYAMDWDFILRAQAAGFTFKRVPRFLASFRVHESQKTSLHYDTGHKEMQRLRLQYNGFVPSQRQVQQKIAPYLIRQFATHWLYRLGLLRH